MSTATKYVPRLSAPSKTDKHWIKSTKGGLNICIEIKNGSVLPNCVGYAWGRFYEIIGTKPKLASLNAEDWYGNTSDGYERSSTPRLGAVACWRKGKVWNGTDGCGHVAIVEEIKKNGDIVCSNSAYGGTRFYMQTYLKSNGYNSGSLTFQGFILPPVDFSAQADTPPSAALSSTAFKIGDVVDFTGSTHYVSSTGTRGTAAKPGRAKITIIAPNTAHPYHIIAECGGGSTVYGWVNKSDIVPKKTIDELAQEVISGDWGNGDERKKRLTAAGYNYYAVQKRVNELL
ncbi:MAG: CHAP domain-containing protein [Oscillospiraceae bacterium]|nr:CHAP domain-containing protein [Oscillospiraceae bacterium]